jgi:hypothetical protein
MPRADGRVGFAIGTSFGLGTITLDKMIEAQANSHFLLSVGF